MYVVMHANMSRRWPLMTARGVMHLVPARPFNLLITNFSATPVEVPKGMLLAQVAEVPRQLVDIYEGPPTDAPIVKLVHCKQSVPREKQMDMARTVTQNDEEKMKDHWQHHRALSQKFKANLAPMFEMLSELSIM